ncbi:MAG: hypothetical protein LBR22_10995 [Desulfovibrio sp.]|jgi:uncharacterized phage-associated protein|nr:hypothetical protein [Desulfovibrio sp.]
MKRQASQANPDAGRRKMRRTGILEMPSREGLHPEHLPPAALKPVRPAFDPTAWRPEGEFADVQDVADFFLTERPDGVPLSNLRLQRLCAYAQGIFWGLRGRRLFGEPLEDLGKGPVVRKLWNRYGDLSQKDPLKPVYLGPPKPILRFAPDERLVLLTVNARYGFYSMERLRRCLRRDFPEKLSDDALERHSRNMVS